MTETADRTAVSQFFKDWWTPIAGMVLLAIAWGSNSARLDALTAGIAGMQRQAEEQQRLSAIGRDSVMSMRADLTLITTMQGQRIDRLETQRAADDRETAAANRALMEYMADMRAMRSEMRTAIDGLRQGQAGSREPPRNVRP